MSFVNRSAAGVGAGIMLAASAGAQSFGAAFDRWNYPFNFTPGVRETASTFSSILDPDPFPGQFDERDGQFLNSFITAGAIAPGAGTSNYIINSATMTASIVGGEFEYADTLTPGASFDLFGTAFRNGLNAFAFGEESTFAFGDPTLEGVRNAYPTDNEGGVLRDVSNDTGDGLSVDPFAIGQIAGATSGDTIVANFDEPVTVTFTLDLSDADVVSFLQQSLNSGIVSLSVTSLHPAETMGGSSSPPSFATKEFRNNVGDLAGLEAVLALDVTVIPAPGAAGVLAAFGIAASRRRRRG